MTVSQREFESLVREVQKLRQELAKRPVRHPAGGAVVNLRTVSVTSGQTLTSGQTGVKYSSSAIASVPSAYDPAVTSTFIDGIGRGVLYVNGVVQTGYVLILNDSTTAIQRALVASDVIAVQDPVSIAVAGDPDGATVSAYPVLFL
ncbi:hypothetical protein [Methylibium sp.]|uniref:hypothetical protein n=1 Tax=Methylibium sp. TaxID=2067992 RepID=UPI0017B17E94|nr:hypothetical protein [Methylibium sp.]MBA3588513.1 hypothetical protein [Methylibium sp.]